jgi:hypothetical protein
MIIQQNRSHLQIVAGTTVAVDADKRLRDLARQHDPIFSAIREHRELSAEYSRAVREEGEAEGFVTAREFAKLEQRTSDATDAMFDAARRLLLTAPTSQFGAIALLRYLEMQLIDLSDGSGMYMPDEVDGEHWSTVAFRTLASALIQIHGSGK